MSERPARIDLLLAGLLTASGLAEALLGLTGAQEPWYVVATVPLATLPVLVRRTRTVPAVACFVSVLLLQAWWGSDLPGGFTEAVVLVLMVYAVGAHTGVPTTFVLLGAILLGLAGVIALGDDPHPANFVYMAAVVLAAWVAGLVVRMTEERSRLLAERSAMQERARIAGELHDVVSHNVSAMVIEAAAERRDQPDDSPAAHTLADIERHGRQTLTELRRLLGVLRIDEAAPLAPQPGIQDLQQLAAAADGSALDGRDQRRGGAVDDRTERIARCLSPGAGVDHQRPQALAHAGGRGLPALVPGPVGGGGDRSGAASSVALVARCRDGAACHG